MIRMKIIAKTEELAGSAVQMGPTTTGETTVHSIRCVALDAAGVPSGMQTTHQVTQADFATYLIGAELTLSPAL
jgi:hypothetical protein